MNNFNFEFILNHSMQTCQIKPPMSFHVLTEIAQERFDLTKITEFFLGDEDIHIKSESDYFEFLNWAENSGMSEIELIVKSGENKAKRKKSSSFRKASLSYKPNNINAKYQAPESGTINDEYCDEYEADIRNRKFNIEEGLYSKHSNKFSEQKRIYHILEKKDRLKAEQVERENERAKMQNVNPNINEEGVYVDPEFGKKNKNKGKKGKKKMDVDSD